MALAVLVCFFSSFNFTFCFSFREALLAGERVFGQSAQFIMHNLVFVSAMKGIIDSAVPSTFESDTGG